jgi:hypothetical protein
MAQVLGEDFKPTTAAEAALDVTAKQYAAITRIGKKAPYVDVPQRDITQEAPIVEEQQYTPAYVEQKKAAGKWTAGDELRYKETEALNAVDALKQQRIALAQKVEQQGIVTPDDEQAMLAIDTERKALADNYEQTLKEYSRSPDVVAKQQIQKRADQRFARASRYVDAGDILRPEVLKEYVMLPVANAVNSFGMNAIGGGMRLLDTIGNLPSDATGDERYYSPFAQTADWITEGLDYVSAGEGTATKEGIFGDDWNVNGDAVLPSLLRTGVYMAGLVGSGAMGGTKALGITSFLTTEEDYYREAINAGLSPQEAQQFSIGAAGATASLEGINPQLYAAGTVKGQMAKRALAALKGGKNTKEAIRDATEFIAKEIGGENAQEFAQAGSDMMAKYMTNMALGEDAMDPSMSMQEVADMVVLTTALSGLMAGVARASDRPLYQQSIEWAVNNADQMRKFISVSVPQGEQEKVLDELDRFEKIHKGLPQDLPPAAKQEVASAVAEKERIKEEQGASIVDDVVSTITGNKYEEAIKQQDERIAAANGTTLADIIKRKEVAKLQEQYDKAKVKSEITGQPMPEGIKRPAEPSPVPTATQVPPQAISPVVVERKPKTSPAAQLTEPPVAVVPQKGPQAEVVVKSDEDLQQEPIQRANKELDASKKSLSSSVAQYTIRETDLAESNPVVPNGTSDMVVDGVYNEFRTTDGRASLLGDIRQSAHEAGIRSSRDDVGFVERVKADGSTVLAVLTGTADHVGRTGYLSFAVSVPKGTTFSKKEVFAALLNKKKEFDAAYSKYEDKIPDRSRLIEYAAKSIGNEIPKAVKGPATGQAKSTTTTAQVTPIAKGPVRPVDGEMTVKSFAESIASGNRLDTPEAVQFYENNKKEIEAELQRMAGPQKQAPQQAPVDTNDDAEVTLDEDVADDPDALLDEAMGVPREVMSDEDIDAEMAKVSKATGVEVVGLDQDEYTEAVDKVGGDISQSLSGGFFMGRNGKIYINRDRFRRGVVAHEGTHAIIFNALLSGNPNGKAIISSSAKQALESSPKAKEALIDFLGYYGGAKKKEDGTVDIDATIADEELAEEVMSEFVASIYNGSIKLDNAMRQFIRDMYNRIMAALGVSTKVEFKEDGDFIAAAKQIASAMKAGRRIETGKRAGGSGTGTGSKFSRLAARTPGTKARPYDHNLAAVDPAAVDMDAMSDKALNKAADMLAKYPGMRIGGGSAKTRIAKAIDRMVGNILYLHDSFPEDVRKLAKEWYVGANKVSLEWAKTYGVTPAQTAGVIAALSPQKDWFTNMSLAERVLDFVANYGDHKWDDAMSERAQKIRADYMDKIEKAKKSLEEKPNNDNKRKELRNYESAVDKLDIAIPKISGKVYNTLTTGNDKAWFLRIWDEANNDQSFNQYLPTGKKTAIQRNKAPKPTKKNPNPVGVPSKIAWQNAKSIAAAIDIAENGTSIDVVSRGIGEAHKVRSFYNNIFDPSSPDFTTIDTHAMAAAMFLPLSGSSPITTAGFGGLSDSASGHSGLYPIYQRAYEIAAKQRGLLPREMQSITWEAVRGLFEKGQKAGAGSSASDVWKAMPSDPDGARAAVSDLFGGISTPGWMGSELQEADKPKFSKRQPDGSLNGLPRKFKVGGKEMEASHWKPAEDVAISYMEKAGLPYNPPSDYVKVDPARAKRIADAYDAMKHDPENPEVKEAYQALADETMAQYDEVMKSGLKVEFIPSGAPDPYAASPRLATDDIRNNNHMWVFGTKDGYGSSFEAELARGSNPLLSESGLEISGQPALINDLFRVVHDYFGHVKEGVGFRADGEENAWRMHSSMFSPKAQRALTTETRGQNSWVNFGPQGEKNRTASGSDTVYADQKTGLLPMWVSEDGRNDSVSEADKPKFSKATPGKNRVPQEHRDNLTDDGKGNYVFFHKGPKSLKGGKINPAYFGTGKTKDNRSNPVMNYYTKPDQGERMISGDVTYAVPVPKWKVYPLMSDPLDLYDKAEANFRKKFGKDQAFDAVRQADFIGPLAEKAGFDMMIAGWSVHPLRAESGKALKPDAKLTKKYEDEGVVDLTKSVDPYYEKLMAKARADRDKQNAKEAKGFGGPKFSKKTPAEVRAGAEKVKAMTNEDRDNYDPSEDDNYEGYSLYEAEKLVPKPTEKPKRVTDSNSFNLWSDWHSVINVDGTVYGLTKYEDPDAISDEEDSAGFPKEYVWAYARMDDQLNVKSTVTNDVAELVSEIKGSSNIKFSKKTDQAFDGKETPKTPIGDTKTVTVDGKERTVFNSNGKPIHPTVEGVRNFWRWFGDSESVDNPATDSKSFSEKDNQPLVLYHGTASDFDSFKVGADGTNSNALGSWGVKRAAMFFTQDPNTAANFASQGRRSGGSVMPVYVSVSKPIDLRDGFDDDAISSLSKQGIDEGWMYRLRADDIWGIFDDSDNGFDTVEAMKAAGYDGAIITEVDPDTGASSDAWVAFSPNQIKSATGNYGSFDPSSPNIKFSGASPENIAKALIAKGYNTKAKAREYMVSKGADRMVDQVMAEFDKLRDAAAARKASAQVTPTPPATPTPPSTTRQDGGGRPMRGSAKRMKEQYPELYAALGEDTIYYDRMPMTVTRDAASELVGWLGLERAKDEVLNRSSDIPDAVRAMMGRMVMKQLADEHRLAELDTFAENFFKLGTSAGQFINALRDVYEEFSKDMIFYRIQRIVEKEVEKKKGKDKNYKKLRDGLTKVNREVAEEVIRTRKVRDKATDASFPKPDPSKKPKTTPAYGSTNKGVKKSQHDQAWRELNSILPSGVVIPQLVTIAAYHIEAGSRSFAAVAERVIAKGGRKLLPYLKGSYKQAAKDMGIEPSTDAEIDEYINKANTDKIVDKLRKAIKANDKKSEAAAIAALQQVAKEDGLWGKYRKEAVSRLTRLADQDIKDDIQKDTIIAEFTAGLVRNITDQMKKEAEAKGLESKEPKTPKPAIEIIGDAYRNFDKYEQVWKDTQSEWKRRLNAAEARLAKATTPEAKQKAQADIVNEQSRLDRLDAYYGELMIKPFSEAAIGRAVKDGMKELDQKIDNIIRQHYTVYEAAKQTLADKLVQGAGLTEVEAAKLADAVKAEFERLATERKKALVEQYAKRKFGDKKVTKTEKKGIEDELIFLTNTGAFGEADFINKYGELRGWPKLTDKNIKEIERLADRIQTAPPGRPRLEAIEDLLGYQENLSGVSKWEVAQSVWFANMLSGFETQEVNFLSNQINVAMEVGVAVAKSTVKGKPMDAVNIVRALGYGFARGWYEAGAVMSTGYSPIRGRVDIPPALERYKFPKYLGMYNGLKMVRRVMVAADVLGFEPLKELRAYQYAAMRARSVDPSPIDRQRALDILNRDDDTIAGAKQQAEDEYQADLKAIEERNLTAAEKRKAIAKAERDKNRRAFELVELARDPEVIQESARFAARATYNYTPEGTLGAVAKGVNMILRELPALRYVVPFVNIIANVTNEALNYYAPVGIARAIAGGSVADTIMGRANKGMTEDQKKMHREDLVSKAVIGLVLQAAVLVLSEPGDDDDPLIEITANGYNNYKQNSEMESKGLWKPYSFRIRGTDTWISYQYTPLLFAFGLVGHLRDATKYRKEKMDDSAMTKYAVAMQRNIGTITDASFLATTADALGWLNDTKEGGLDGLARSTAKTVKAMVVPYSALLNQIQQNMDSAFGVPKMDTRGSLTAELIKNTPVAYFVRDKFPIMVDALGDPIIPSSGALRRFATTSDPDPSLLQKLFISAPAPDRFWRLMVDKKYPLSAPNPKTVTVYDDEAEKERILTQDELFKFYQVRGSMIKMELNDRFDELSTLDNKEFAEEMKAIQSYATSEAKWEATEME